MTVDPPLPPHLSTPLWRWWGRRDEWLLVAMAILPFSLLGSAVLLLLGSGFALASLDWQKDRSFHRMMLMVAMCLLVVTAASGTGDAWLGLANYLPFLLPVLFVGQLLRSPLSIRRFLVAMIVGSWGISVLGLGQFIWRWNFRWVWLGGLIHVKLLRGYSGRPTSVFTNPNALALYLLMILAIAIGLLLERSSQVQPGAQLWLERGILVGAIAMGAPLLVLTESRNAWLVTVLALMGVFVLLRKWWLLGGVMGMIFIPIGAAVNVLGLRAIVPRTIWQKLVDSVDPSTASFRSITSRWEGWKFAVQMVGERPVAGWGWQSFDDQWLAQVPEPTVNLHHAHNIYLSIAAEGGLLALAAMMVLWGWVVWRGWRAWVIQCKQESRDQSLQVGYVLLGVNVSLLSYFVAGLLDAPFFDGRLNFFVWTMLGVALAAWRVTQPQRNSQSPDLEGQIST